MPLSNGRWMCTTTYTYLRPTGEHPSGPLGPVVAEETAECGLRYVEPDERLTRAVCFSCTLFADGYCADCGRPQCSHCVREDNGAQVCDRCRALRVDERRREDLERAEERSARAHLLDVAVGEYRAAMDDWGRQVVAELVDKGVTREAHGWRIGSAVLSSDHVVLGYSRWDRHAPAVPLYGRSQTQETLFLRSNGSLRTEVVDLQDPVPMLMRLVGRQPRRATFLRTEWSERQAMRVAEHVWIRLHVVLPGPPALDEFVQANGLPPGHSADDLRPVSGVDEAARRGATYGGGIPHSGMSSVG